MFYLSSIYGNEYIGEICKYEYHFEDFCPNSLYDSSDP